MLKKILMFLIFILLVLQVFAYDLSDFPKFFNMCNLTVLIGKETNTEDLKVAVDILGPLLPKQPRYELAMVRPRIPCNEPMAKLPEEIGNLASQDLILVGGPCANKITAQIMNLSTSWPECAEGFENGTGRIILYNKWNHMALYG